MRGREMKRSTRALAAFFTFAGAMHFVRPRSYIAIMPDYLPAHRELVYASGAAEIVGGLGALPERTRRAAGWWLAATMVAVFPANLHMALHPERYRRIPPALLYARLPVQALIIVWALRATRQVDAGT
ncbi:MAG TPA: DoxX family protein [Solirubrobacteraceae bacterium]|nr:DoxX family protein [Solirubrobacteraceae bacterium]